MDDEFVEALSLLNKEQLKSVLEKVAAEKGGDIAALLAPSGATNPLLALGAARNAIVAWAEQEDAQLAKRQKLFYAIEVDDISRRVAGDIALPGRDEGIG